MKYEISSGVFSRHCTIELIKHVLPRFSSPSNPGIFISFTLVFLLSWDYSNSIIFFGADYNLVVCVYIAAIYVLSITISSKWHVALKWIFILFSVIMSLIIPIFHSFV